MSRDDFAAAWDHGWIGLAEGESVVICEFCGERAWGTRYRPLEEAMQAHRADCRGRSAAIPCPECGNEGGFFGPCGTCNDRGPDPAAAQDREPGKVDLSKFQRCPVCNKLFYAGIDLYDHIQRSHRG